MYVVSGGACDHVWAAAAEIGEWCEEDPLRATTSDLPEEELLEL